MSPQIQRLRRAAFAFGGDAVCESEQRLAGGRWQRRFSWPYGSTFIVAWHEGDSAAATSRDPRSADSGEIVLRAVLVVAPRRTDRPLLDRWSKKIRFGELVVDDDGDLTLECRCRDDDSELEHHLLALCLSADDIDESLSRELGGDTSEDALDERLTALLTSPGTWLPN